MPVPIHLAIIYIGKIFSWFGRKPSGKADLAICGYFVTMSGYSLTEPDHTILPLFHYDIIQSAK